MTETTFLPRTSSLEVLEKANGQPNRADFPVLASTLDKKYGMPGVFVVRWTPFSEIVELSDGSTVIKP